MEAIFMNTENSKNNEPHRFRLTLADKLTLKNPKIWHWLIYIFITLGKILRLHITKINLNSLFQL